MMHPTAAGLALFTSLVLVPSTVSAGGSPEPDARRAPSLARALDHEALAVRFAEWLGYESPSADDLDFESVLAESFVRFDLGLYEVFAPVPSLSDAGKFELTRRALRALVQSQEQWAAWIEPASSADVKALGKDLSALDGWLKSIKPAKFAEGLAGGARVGLDVASAKDNVREASARAAQSMRSGAPLELGREKLSTEPVVLIPERGRFVEAIAFAGWVRSDLESSFWLDDIHTWTNFYLEQYKVLAMQYASPGGSPQQYEASMDMSSRTATGLEQQIVQLSTNSLIDNYYGAKIPPTLAGGLAINLVVDLFGECNTRADGDLSERRTEAVEVFIPGGNPTGGFLGTQMADSRWRTNQGADRFARVLRGSQKDGAGEVRKGKDKLRYFEIQNEAGSEKKILEAPFLGSAAKARELPASFTGDELEFLRAYRCAFVWWLQNESLGGKKSKQAFARFLIDAAQIEDASAVEPLLATVFDDTPLSTPELDRKGELEGRFLYWLSKKK